MNIKTLTSGLIASALISTQAFAAGTIITIVNKNPTAIIFFNASVDGANLLKSAIEPNASTKVNIGKDCNVTIAIDFEDGTSIEPVKHNFCKDHVLRVTEEK
jgi:hypothetical protein